MNFMEAVKAMKEGKKVRREGWDGFICLKDNFFYWNDGDADKRVEMALSNLEATDWEELVEDKKTLSDYFIDCIGGYGSYREDKVKQFIKDILDRAKIVANDTDEDRERIDWESLKQIVQEEAGGRLI